MCVSEATVTVLTGKVDGKVSGIEERDILHIQRSVAWLSPAD